MFCDYKIIMLIILVVVNISQSSALQSYGWVVVGGLALGWVVRDSPIIERNVTF